MVFGDSGKELVQTLPLPFLVQLSTDINLDDGSLRSPLVTSEPSSFSSHMSNTLSV